MPCKTGRFLCLGFLGTDIEISIHVHVFRGVARKSQQCCRQESQVACTQMSLFSPVESSAESVGYNLSISSLGIKEPENVTPMCVTSHLSLGDCE